MTKHDCVPRWKKSSYSGNQGGACLETAALTPAVGVRDSKDLNVGQLIIAASSWASLTESIKSL
ncbi:DUF397 domain-containing protein [Yinghuangia seranimata]|uniref:DUF397 domain-containing protein n=1 Tax=Yinghuangia seranimata TaxID=408067 RepID=UPI00248CA869|nr:DUF397 domain-containing protein [Yinghuangia seranimata]MDI2132533.1 DUF397 domain-containing protein [Yinghuangia seranimata]